MNSRRWAAFTVVATCAMCWFACGDPSSTPDASVTAPPSFVGTPEPQIAADPPVFPTVVAQVIGSTTPDEGVTALAAINDVVWIAVNRGIVMSTDRGQHWRVASTLADAVHSLSFTSERDGWAATGAGLLQTHDGGESWRVAVSVPVDEITRVRFVEGAHGWITTSNGPLRTRDGGLSWQSVVDGCGGTPGGFPRLYSFYDASGGWLLCPGQSAAGAQARDLYRTTDGGASWTLFSCSQFGNPSCPAELAGLTDCGYALDLQFVSEDEGWIGSNRCGLAHTGDGAKSWEQVPSDAFGWDDASEVFFTSRDRGYAIGRGLHETVDGGRTWSLRYEYLSQAVADGSDVAGAGRWLPGYRVWSSAADGSGEIWAVASRCTQRFDPSLQEKAGRSIFEDCEYPAKLLRSIDNGSAWTVIDLSGVEPSRIESADPPVVFDHLSKYVSNDGGSTWVRVHPDPLTGEFP